MSNQDKVMGSVVVFLILTVIGLLTILPFENASSVSSNNPVVCSSGAYMEITKITSEVDEINIFATSNLPFDLFLGSKSLSSEKVTDTYHVIDNKSFPPGKWHIEKEDGSKITFTLSSESGVSCFKQVKEELVAPSLIILFLIYGIFCLLYL